MRTVIIDYGSGNLHSAEKSFQRMALETGAGEVIVSDRVADLKSADRIVLPGVGAFADCRAGVDERAGLLETLQQRVLQDGVPFMGICVGMQLLATVGQEFGETPGFDWIPGVVEAMVPSDKTLKIPHMGWNELVVHGAHPCLEGVDHGEHAYFVHSYHLRCDQPDHMLAGFTYGGEFTAAVGRDNIFGTQFHPEKSQKTGLRVIANFLSWKP